MPLLHIFNPETEMALADGTVNYTAPRAIAEFRCGEALLPAIYAGPGDAILMIDNADPRSLKYFDLVQEKGLTVFTPGMKTDWSRFSASPWGWNRQIAAWLRRRCPGLSDILSDEEIVRIRNLAHRRTAARVLADIPEKYRRGISVPHEFFDVDEAMNYCEAHPALFLKAPWSSSGRGVIRSDLQRTESTGSWIRGVINRQGSVMAEPVYDKVLDFATEWRLQDGEPEFLGLSVFETSGRGKYHGNVRESQESLLRRIRDVAPGFSYDYIDCQAVALKKLFKGYSGPCGIDMLVTRDGHIHPCVEINVRHTMGSILL